MTNGCVHLVSYWPIRSGPYTFTSCGVTLLKKDQHRWTRGRVRDVDCGNCTRTKAYQQPFAGTGGNPI